MVVGKLARGAISLTGNIFGRRGGGGVEKGEQADEVVLEGVSLRIISKAKIPEAATLAPGLVGVNPEEITLAHHINPTCFMYLKDGSDCVIKVQGMPGVPLGYIALEEAHMYNLRVGEDIQRAFKVFLPPTDSPFTLTDVTFEVRLRSRPHVSDEDRSRSHVSDEDREGDEDKEESTPEVTVDVSELTHIVNKSLFGRIVAVGETMPMDYMGTEVLLRVVSTNNVDQDEQADLVFYHCYRGMVTADTQVYIERATGLDQGLALTNAKIKAGTGRTNHLVHITTCDEEWFPVKKRLLRACIALTKQVQDKSDHASEVTVQVDCLTFDRVLLFLEAEALGRAKDFNVDINQVELLLAAALHLGCRPLEDLCRKMKGDFANRIREYSFDEVKQANDAGQFWILVDFMVLDVTRWLPEHPGGKSIIPKQALNLDATCFFELYHVSRESFMYLKQFYIGEVQLKDRPFVPSATPGSAEFMQQLRQYTSFRVQAKAPKVLKSF